MPETPLHLWNLPSQPRNCNHIDFTGPMDGRQWFVIIDAYSRWSEILTVSTASTSNVIKVLLTLIACYGVFKTLVFDNGTPFNPENLPIFVLLMVLRLLLLRLTIVVSTIWLNALFVYLNDAIKNVHHRFQILNIVCIICCFSIIKLNILSLILVRQNYFLVAV